MLLNRPNWRPHRPWLILVCLVTLASIVWSWIASDAPGEFPGGSSLPGFTFGVAGGVIILFEFLLWFRKKVRVWRIGTAQSWMRVHIWLGLLCLPLLVLHSGLRLGGTLSTILMVLLIIVIASGVWGLTLQNLLPRRMLDEIPAETIYSQMDYLVAQMLSEGDRLIASVCASSSGEVSAAATKEPHRDDAGPLVVGAVRVVGAVQGKVLATRVPTQPIAETEALALFYRGQVVPFLREGNHGSPLANPHRASVLFDNLRTQIPPAAHEVADTLAGFCEQRRQWDRQATLHFWLHNWLWLHFPLSVALVVLMGVHVWVALKYW